ncbi:MAG: hypothetical protein ACI8RZ_004882 [Myxococcota bacterium]|jgi:hypothetical protein
MDPARCAAIPDASLAGECASLTARELAQDGQTDAALATCQGMAAGGWRDECFFLISDVSGLSGDAAKQACAAAGQFRNQCVGHAIAREVSAVLNATEPGKEAEAYTQLDVVVQRYIPGREREGKIRQIMAGYLADRSPDKPFSQAHCGSAPQMICQEAYIERMRNSERAAGRSDGEWRRACGTHVSLERAVSLGLPGWTPDFAGLARASWEQLCRR